LYSSIQVVPEGTVTVNTFDVAELTIAFIPAKVTAQRLEALEVLRSQKPTINGVRQKFQRVFKLVDHQIK